MYDTTDARSARTRARVTRDAIRLQTGWVLIRPQTDARPAVVLDELGTFWWACVSERLAELRRRCDDDEVEALTRTGSTPAPGGSLLERSWWRDAEAR